MDARIKQLIEDAINQHDVVLFMKGNADFPQCGFSGLVANVLAKLGVTFHDVNILSDNELREGIKEYSDWPTIPQLYIKGEFIGGCDIVKELYSTGELQALLQEKNIEFIAQ